MNYRSNRKWTVAIVLIILGLLLFIIGGRNLLILSKDPIDVMNADPSTLKAGDHVRVEVSLVWDEIISVTETTKTYGVTTSTREASRYYAIPYLTVIDYDGDEIPIADADQFILLKMSSSYFDTMNRAMDNTNEWYDLFWSQASQKNFDPSRLPSPPATVLTFEGRLVKVNSEEMGYAVEYLKWLEYETNSDHPTLESYIVPYYIDPIMKPGSFVWETIIGAAILLAGILVFVFTLRKDREEKEMEQVLAVQRPRVINTEDDQQSAPAAQRVTFNNSIGGGSPGAGGAPASGAPNSFGGTSVYGGGAAGAAAGATSFGSNPAPGAANNFGSVSVPGGANNIGGASVYRGGAAGAATGAASFGSNPAPGAANSYGGATPSGATGAANNFGSASSSGAAGGAGASAGSFSSQPVQLPLGGSSQANSFASSPKPLPMGGGSSEIRHIGGDSAGDSGIGNPLPTGNSFSMGHSALPTGSSEASSAGSSSFGSGSSVSGPYMGSAPSTGSSSFGNGSSVSGPYMGSAPSTGNSSFGSGSSVNGPYMGSAPSTGSSSFGSGSSVSGPYMGSAPSTGSSSFGSGSSVNGSYMGSAPSTGSSSFGSGSSVNGPYMGSAPSAGGPYMGGAFGNSASHSGPSAPMGPSSQAAPPMGGSVLTGGIALPTDNAGSQSSSDGDKNDSN